MEFFLLVLLSALASNSDSNKTADVVSSPDVVAEAPAVVTEAPAVVTEAPAVVTEAPAVVAEAPAVDTEAPQVVTEPKMTLSLFSGRDRGIKTTSLSFGVPETDNVMFSASCRADNASARPIAFDLSASFGGAANLDNVNMVMRSGGSVQAYIGKFLVVSEEYAAGSFQFAIDDPVLATGAQTGALTFGTEIGVPSLEADFSDTKDLLKQFLADCADHAQVARSIEPLPDPTAGGASGSQTAQVNVEAQAQQDDKVDVQAQDDDKLAATADPDALAWRRERVDLGEFNEVNKGLRGSILTAMRPSEGLPIFRSFCSEDSIDNARMRLQFFSRAQLPARGEERDVYLRFNPGEEYLENILKPFDASFTGRVVRFRDTSAVQISFGHDARFWSAMEVGQDFLYQINPGERRIVQLKDAGRIVSQFRNDCATYEKAAEAKVEAEKQASGTSNEPTGEDTQSQQQVAEVKPAPETTQTTEIVPVAPVPVTPEAVTSTPVTPAPPPTPPSPGGNIALPAASDQTKRWMASRGRLNGLRTSFLRYGTTGGGEAEFVAVCSEGDASTGSISVWHNILDFPGEANKRIKLTYVVDGKSIRTTFGETFDHGDVFEGVRYKSAAFGNFFNPLAASEGAAVQVGDLGAIQMPLDGSAQPMMFFQHDCKTLRDEAKEALKAAGNDKTPPKSENWHILSRTIGAAISAEANGVIVEEAPSDKLTWSKGQATFNNKPFSYVRLDHKGYGVPSVFAACNAVSTGISNVQFWFALDAGAAQSKNLIIGNYVFGEEKQRKHFRPFGQQTGYRGVSASMPYFGKFWRTMARNGALTVELEDVAQPAQYPLAGGHKPLLQFMADCSDFRDEARETEKTTGKKQETDLVDPNQLIRLASTGNAQTQQPAAPTQQTAASATGGVYRCDNGRQMQIALAPRNVAVKVDYQGLPTMELPSIDNNAGSSFSDGFFTLVTNDAEARLIWGNTTRICKR